MDRILLETLLADRRQQKRLITAIRTGRVIIYPTDTVYGIGCDATNPAAVERIRQIKQTGHPFSVIAPSREWIAKHFIIRYPAYLQKLPGPCTLILEMKKPVVAEHVSFGQTLGVRIPHHPLTPIIQQSGVPVVTTSCNRSGAPPITALREVPATIAERVDIAVDGGRLGQQASTIIDLTGEKPKQIR